MVSAEVVTVGATAGVLNDAATGGITLHILNTDDTNGVDLGASGVAAGEGYPLAAGDALTVELQPGDVLYAIRSASADVDLAVLRT